jgi:hypothetical protein
VTTFLFGAQSAATSSSFYWLLVASLVTWRLTHLLQAEDGPWNVIVRLRLLVGTSVIGDLLDCFYCLSIWVALPFACLIGANWKERLLIWPALSGAATLLERVSQPSLPTVINQRLGESTDVLLRQEQSPSSESTSPNTPNAAH